MRHSTALKASSFVLLAFALGACSTTETKTSSIDADARLAEIQQRQADLKAQESKIAESKRSLQQKQAQLDQEAARLKQAEADARAAAERTAQRQTTPMQTASNEMLPPAKAGQCYARVFAPPQYDRVTERVLQRAASERIEVIPAKYETVTERVLVQAESERLEVIPATYKWVEERVMIKPATQRIQEVPPAYETVTEQVLIKAAHTMWKKGTGPIQKVDQATGEIMCLVEVPAQYQTVTKRVLKTPATTRVTEIPAVFETVKQRVIDQPASTRVVKIPAKYDTVKVTKLVQASQEKRIPIAEEYATVTKMVMSSEGKMEWREILCETNTTPTRISQLQQALTKAGYNPGPADGIVGTQTIAAVNAFQKDKGLPVDKYLNVTTLQALGVSPR